MLIESTDYLCHGCFSRTLNVEVSVSLTIKGVADMSLKISFGLWDRTFILNIFEINYSQLIQYEILEKLVTFIGPG